MAEVVREFFIDEVAGESFVLFSWIHFMCIIITILGLFIIYINREKISKLDDKKKRKIIIAIIVIMFINMKLYYIPLMLYGKYDWTRHLPLHFCFISGYSFMYALLTNNHKIYKLTYFFAFMGPIPAILFPDPVTKNSFEAFGFYQFFISHHFFLMANMFVYYSGNYKIQLKDVKRAFVVANYIFITMAIFNLIFKTNYIMSNNLPEHVIQLFPFLSKVNFPFIVIEITGIIVLTLAYIPIYFRNKEKTKNSGLQQVESLL